jgi:SAM-dependent methyltransferase
MDKAYMTEYASLETNHWWFKARIEILAHIIQKKNILNRDKLNILNVGVASGGTTRMLEKFGSVTSLEFDKDCCEYLKNVANIDVVEGSLTKLPFENNTYDLVCAFDVIEHIEDDSKAMAEIYRVLKINGHAMITVPAFQFLWSNHDVVNHHYRRYSKKRLQNLISQNLKIEYLTFFNFLLFSPIAFTRIIGRIKKTEADPTQIKSDFEFQKNNKLLNRIFYEIFGLEKILLPSIILPFGVSLLTICTKKAPDL